MKRIAVATVMSIGRIGMIFADKTGTITTVVGDQDWRHGFGIHLDEDGDVAVVVIRDRLIRFKDSVHTPERVVSDHLDIGPVIRVDVSVDIRFGCHVHVGYKERGGQSAVSYGPVDLPCLPLRN